MGTDIWGREVAYHLAADRVRAEAALALRGDPPAECPREFEACGGATDGPDAGQEGEDVGPDTKQGMVARMGADNAVLRRLLKEAEGKVERVTKQRDDLLTYSHLLVDGWQAEADERRRLAEECRRLTREQSTGDVGP